MTSLPRSVETESFRSNCVVAEELGEQPIRLAPICRVQAAEQRVRGGIGLPADLLEDEGGMVFVGS
jgi:hypothetical protein